MYSTRKWRGKDEESCRDRGIFWGFRDAVPNLLEILGVTTFICISLIKLHFNRRFVSIIVSCLIFLYYVLNKCNRVSSFFLRAKSGRHLGFIWKFRVRATRNWNRLGSFRSVRNGFEGIFAAKFRKRDSKELAHRRRPLYPWVTTKISRPDSLMSPTLFAYSWRPVTMWRKWRRCGGSVVTMKGVNSCRYMQHPRPYGPRGDHRKYRQFTYRISDEWNEAKKRKWRGNTLNAKVLYYTVFRRKIILHKKQIPTKHSLSFSHLYTRQIVYQGSHFSS